MSQYNTLILSGLGSTYVYADAGYAVHDHWRPFARYEPVELDGLQIVLLVPLDRVELFVLHVDVAQEDGALARLDHARNGNLQKLYPANSCVTRKSECIALLGALCRIALACEKMFPASLLDDLSLCGSSDRYISEALYLFSKSVISFVNHRCALYYMK